MVEVVNDDMRGAFRAESGAKRKKTETQTEQTPEQKQAQAEAYLNNADFQKHLDQDPDFAIENQDLIIERGKAVEKGVEVAKDLKNIFREKISKDIGIELSEKELESVDEYLHKLAKENPGEIDSLQEKIAGFTESETKLQRQREILGEVGDMDALQAEQALLAVAKEEKLSIKERLAAFFQDSEIRSHTDEGNKAVEQLREEYNLPVEMIGKRFKEVKQAIEKGAKSEAEIKAIDNEFGEARRHLLKEMEPARAITAIAQQKFKEQLIGKRSEAKGNKAKLEEYRVYAEGVSKPVAGVEADIDYFGPDNEKEKVLERINGSIDASVTKKINKLVQEIPIQNGAYERLEKTLDEFVNSTELIGPRSRAKSKQFRIDSLVAMKGDTKVPVSKRVMVEQFLAKRKLINNNGI